jgi:hypothetical protein
MKRAAFDNPFLDPKLRFDDEPRQSVKIAGQELREFLIYNYSIQTVVTAAFIGNLCARIIAAGGTGVEDLACPDDHNSSRHLNLILGRLHTGGL